MVKIMVGVVFVGPSFQLAAEGFDPGNQATSNIHGTSSLDQARRMEGR